MTMDNINPTIFERCADREVKAEEEDEHLVDEIDNREIYDHIRDINDPEHPLSLEALNVVSLDQCCISSKTSPPYVSVEFTPTIPHCSMATLIGLAIRVKLLRVLPQTYKVDVVIAPGSHVSEVAINKQLADKERVRAALENPHLLQVVNQCLDTMQNS